MYRVLVAEDELLVRMGLISSISWEEHGLTIESVAEDGTTAWELWEKNRPDIVLTDLRMPGMDGITFIEKIRQCNENCRIIVISCLEDFEILYKLMQLGISGYLLKATMQQQDIEKQLIQAVRQLNRLKAPETNLPAESADPLAAFLLEHHDPLRYRREMQEAGKEASFPTAIILLRLRSEKNPVLCSSIQRICCERLSAFGKIFPAADGREICIFAVGPTAESQQQLLTLLEELRRYEMEILNTEVQTVLCFLPPDESGIFTILEHCRTALCQPYFLSKEILLFHPENPDAPLPLPAGLQREAESLRELAALTPWRSPKKCQEFFATLNELLVPPLSRDRFLQNLCRMTQLYCAFTENLRDREEPSVYCERMALAPSAQQALSIFTHQVSAISLEASPLYGQKILQTLYYIRKNLADNLSLSQLAAMVSLSPNYYASLFKKVAGCTFSDYLGSVRIEKACRLLCESNLSVQKIASICGFSDSPYFIRYFKQKLGLPPHQWRTAQ